MPAPVPVPFWTQHYEARSRVVTAERLINWYIEQNPQNAKYPYALYPTPGLRILTTLGSGPIRGLHQMDGTNDLYAVSGNTCYHVTSSLVVTEIGEVKGAGNVHMTSNGSHVLIVTDKYAYAANATSIVQIPEEDLVGAAYQDGYAIAGKRRSEQFNISDLDDLTGWTATEFSSADALADPLVTVISLHRQLIIFGAWTTEWWVNTGEADFPFARAPGGFMEIGCLAPGSPGILGNTVLWLGHDKQVYRAVGFDAQPISTPGIVNTIEKLASPQTAWGFAYAHGGHSFYVLSWSDLTLVYDLTTGLWHRRKSWNKDRWRANCYEYIWGKHVVGDVETGNLYELDHGRYTEPRTTTGSITAFASGGVGKTQVTSAAHGLANNDVVTIVGTDNYDGTYVVSSVATNTFVIKRTYVGTETGTWWRDEQIRREADSAPLHNRGDPAVMHEFFVDMETGVGIDGSGQGSDPELMISWSDDGSIYSNEVAAKIGKLGQRDTQVRIWGLGEFQQQRTMRVAISDPVKAVLLGAWANLEPRPR